MQRSPLSTSMPMVRLLSGSCYGVDAEAHQTIRLHLTNVTGLGATQLVGSLLPALEQIPNLCVEQVYLPDRGLLSSYKGNVNGDPPKKYRRRLPNGLSRLLECTLLGGQFDGDSPLLVLGNLPIRCRARQVLFVQTPFLACGGNEFTTGNLRAMKHHVSRLIFRINLRYAAAIVVQTEAMKDALLASYPAIAGNIHVVAQPVPSWLLESSLRRTGRVHGQARALDLFYPAAGYPHKNHRLLRGISREFGRNWPVNRLVLTIPCNTNPNPEISWIECVDYLSQAAVLARYRLTDALVFLSNAESYGFPLVEAMWIGLPIICPDLPYARTLCGDEAIYFDPRSVDSLHSAVTELSSRLGNGWWPSWTRALQAFPTSWEQVAEELVRITTEATIRAT